MSYRSASIVALVLVGTVLTVAFPAAEPPGATRWIVPLQSERQLDGILRAAEARQSGLGSRRAPTSSPRDSGVSTMASAAKAYMRSAGSSEPSS